MDPASTNDKRPPSGERLVNRWFQPEISQAEASLAVATAAVAAAAKPIPEAETASLNLLHFRHPLFRCDSAVEVTINLNRYG
jgi:hypothetical protein